MNILILGAAGFIGTNLAIGLAKDETNVITLADKSKSFFSSDVYFRNTEIVECSLNTEMDFSLLEGKDIVYHLVSTNAPSTSNHQISHDIEENVVFSTRLFDACVQYGIKKVVFLSSGGTVYGKEAACPISEDTLTKPICSYGVQKIMIEKLLYLYHYTYGLDYRIIRLSNPYGPYQRPDGGLGAVSTFIYKALKGEPITVYGDGTVVRDFIYIDDAIRGILNIVNGENEHRIFNLGSGCGTSINDLLETIQKTLQCDTNIAYKEQRAVDVPINYLDIGRYETYYGQLNPITLEAGVKMTAEFMKRKMLS